MLRPFENLLAMRRATMLQGRITEQRDVGIWNEVWEPPPPPTLPNPLPSLFHLFYLDIQTSMPPMPSDSAQWRSIPPLVSISRVCGVLFVAGWVSAQGNSRHGSFERREQREERSFIKRKTYSAMEAVKCKVDKWLMTSRNEMIHHFLKLSSLKGCLWRSGSVLYVIVYEKSILYRCYFLIGKI